MTAEYDRGYHDGIAGLERDKTADSDYIDGWFDGEADRPTIDDLVDAAKERTDPLGH